MNQRQLRQVERIKELIVSSDSLLGKISRNDWGQSWVSDKTELHTWLIKCRNIIKIALGVNSIHYIELDKCIGDGNLSEDGVKSVKGIIVGALDDFENGFTTGQEILIAGEIFDSVLEEAKHLLATDHKEAAAVLGRVTIEDSLKRIARREVIDDTLNASRINDALKKNGNYMQPQWRLIQSWLDIGNASAHGNFNDFTKNDVGNMLTGIGQFMANNF